LRLIFLASLLPRRYLLFVTALRLAGGWGIIFSVTVVPGAYSRTFFYSTGRLIRETVIVSLYPVTARRTLHIRLSPVYLVIAKVINIPVLTAHPGSSFGRIRWLGQV
jgi:hypothetical protein